MSGINVLRRRFKSLVAAAIAVVLLLLSPGLPCYQALAQEYDAAGVAVRTAPEFDAAALTSAVELSFSVHPEALPAYPLVRYQFVDGIASFPIGLDPSTALHPRTHLAASFQPGTFPGGMVAAAHPIGRAPATSLGLGMLHRALREILPTVRVEKEEVGGADRGVADPGRPFYDGAGRTQAGDSPIMAEDERDASPPRQDMPPDHNAARDIVPAREQSRLAKRAQALAPGKTVLLVGVLGAGQLAAVQAAASKHGVRLVVADSIGGLESAHHRILPLPGVPASKDIAWTLDRAVVLHQEYQFDAVMASEGFEQIAGRIVNRLNQVNDFHRANAVTALDQSPRRTQRVVADELRRGVAAASARDTKFKAAPLRAFAGGLAARAVNRAVAEQGARALYESPVLMRSALYAELLRQLLAEPHVRRAYSRRWLKSFAAEAADRAASRLLRGCERVRGDTLEHALNFTREGMRERLKPVPVLATTVRRNLRSRGAAQRAFADMGGGPRDDGTRVAVRLWSPNVPGVEFGASSKQEVAEHYDRLATMDRNRQIAMDRSWEGPQIHVDAVVQRKEGKLEAVLSAVSDALTSQGLIFPSMADAELRAGNEKPAHQPIIGTVLKTAELLGIEAGPIRVVMRWTPEGPKVEDVVRHFWGSALHFSAPGSAVEAELLSLLGVAVPSPASIRGEAAAQSRDIVPGTAGKISAIEGLQDLASDPTIRVFQVKKVGDEIGPSEAAIRVSVTAHAGENPEQLDARVGGVLARIRIAVQGAAPRVGSLVGRRVEVIGEHRRLAAAAERRAARIYGGYMFGQKAATTQLNIRKATLIPLGVLMGGMMTAATGAFTYYVGVALASLIGAPLVARIRLWKIISRGFLVQTLLWVCIVPLACYLYSPEGLNGLAQAAMVARFNHAYFYITLFQGALTGAFLNITDCDADGLRLLSRRHHLPYDEHIINDLNGGQYTWRSLVILVFPPLMALGAVFLAMGVVHNAGLALAVALAFVNLVPALFGLPAYLRSLPRGEDMGNPEPIREVKSELIAAARIICGDDFIRNRSILGMGDRTVFDAVPGVMMSVWAMKCLGFLSDAVSQAWSVVAYTALVSAGMLGMFGAQGVMGDWAKWQKKFPAWVQPPLDLLKNLCLRLTPSALHGWTVSRVKDYRIFFPVQRRAMRFVPWIAVSALLTTSSGAIAGLLAHLGIVPLFMALVILGTGVLIAVIGSFNVFLNLNPAQRGFGTWMMKTVKDRGHDENGRELQPHIVALQTVASNLVTGLVQGVALAYIKKLGILGIMVIIPICCLIFGEVTARLAPRWLGVSANPVGMPEQKGGTKGPRQK